MDQQTCNYLLDYLWSQQCALGFSLTNQPQLYAMHSYFLHRRSRAMSIAVATCGFGPVIVPLLVGQLLELYNPEGTMLVLAALVLHSLPASILLQPVRWHMRPLVTEQPPNDKRDTYEDAGSSSLVATITSRRQRTITVNSADIDCHSLYVPDTPIVHRTLSTSTVVTSRPTLARSVSEQPRTHLVSTSHWWSSDDTDVGSSQMFEDICLAENLPTIPEVSSSRNGLQKSIKKSEKEVKPSQWKRLTSRIRSFGTTVVNYFDLGLFFEPGYTIIALGMSIAMFSEVANVIAAVGACDIICRFAAPYVADALHASYKTMYLGSLLIFIVIRSLMIVFYGYPAMLVLGGALGLGKGLRAVFMPLVIPSHVPLDRLPAAMGLQLICNGILFITVGPLLGVLRDWSGSYLTTVVAVNVLTVVTLVMWTRKSVVMWCKGCCRISQHDSI